MFRLLYAVFTLFLKSMISESARLTVVKFSYNIMLSRPQKHHLRKLYVAFVRAEADLQTYKGIPLARQKVVFQKLKDDLLEGKRWLIGLPTVAKYCTKRSKHSYNTYNQKLRIAHIYNLFPCQLCFIFRKQAI